MAITHGQRKALAFLKRRHDEYPMHKTFATVHLGDSYAAQLRRLVPQGLVTATRGGRGSRQFFAITDAGKELFGEDA